MKNLRQPLEINETETMPQPLGESRWDWSGARRVLIVRLRSIGDTVLSTPSLYALRRFLPHAQIDVLLEDWVAPLLDGFEDVDNVIRVQRKDTKARVRLAQALRSTPRYDVAYNLHGGTTATFLIRASGARHRVGFKGYRYGFLYNHLAPSSSELWRREKTHSVEQQLALLGWTGVPVSDRPRTRLAVTEKAKASVEEKLKAAKFDCEQPFALVHPAAAFESKQWPTKNFARVVEELNAKNISSIAIAAASEKRMVEELKRESGAPVVAFTDLQLPEITALASLSKLFVGNDSGIAHIAAAVQKPCVVIFGSSNVDHWRPWTNAPNEIVREEMPCAPCPGYACSEFERPECIRRVTVERVTVAIERVLKQ
jgi:lipopolysaccharide heptosyltransferase II